MLKVGSGKRQIAACCLLIGLLFSPLGARAEFVLNFTPNYDYRMPGSNSAMRDYYWNSDNVWGKKGFQTGVSGTTPQTPYLYDTNYLERPEIVRDADGNYYYHMIIGTLADGFIQETYIQMGFGTYGNADEPTGPTSAASASGGTGTYISTAPGATIRDPNSLYLGNGYDPLDANVDERARHVVSGSGTANPNRVIMRQLISDGEIFMEFLKDRFAYKPRISQMLMGPGITMSFDIDMRNIDYQTLDTVAPILNTMELWGEGTPPDQAAFNMQTDVQDSNANAGEFTYTPGSGPGGSEGLYQYKDGGLDQTALDWSSYLNPYTNNPWAFEEAKPK